MTRTGWLRLGLLLGLAHGPAAAQSASPDSFSLFPEQGVFSHDRVDLQWTVQGSRADSIVVDLGDGARVRLQAAARSYRHAYKAPGVYRPAVTVWSGGVGASLAAAAPLTVAQRAVPTGSAMFVHHSTGRYMLRDSGVRSILEWHDAARGTDIRFWDHDYHSGNSYTGIILPDSTVHPDWSYGVEANTITPSGYRDIYDGSAFRDSLFARHDVIIFKNDHSTGDIADDAQLQQYFADYLAIRDVLDQHPDKLFVLMSGPPRRPEAIGNAEADRARAFYEWLQSPAFMHGHPNLMFFDLFDALAYPDDPADPERNMLRAEYRLPPAGSTDSHPNELANTTVGPLIAALLISIYDPDWISAAPPTAAPRPLAVLAGNSPNPFNPRTSVRWELDRGAVVGLSVFDLSGRLVRTMLRPTWLDAGPHVRTWDGDADDGLPSPSGVYLLRLDAGTERHARRMTLLR